MMYRRFFRWCLYSILVALWTMPLSSRAVAFRYVKNFIVMESTLFYQDKVLPHEVGVSTTSTHCLMDSTYAVNVLKVDVAHLKSAVMNKKEGGYYSLQLDSLNFCGETYRNVTFVVMEMQQKFKGKVPDLVLGNSILSHRAWHVDLQRHTFTPCSPPVLMTYLWALLVSQLSAHLTVHLFLIKNALVLNRLITVTNF